MTWAAQNPEQAQVVATEAELTVVLGGAGVGKTTSALAAAAAHLERVRETKPHDRVLFLSFSRASLRGLPRGRARCWGVTPTKSMY